MDDGTADGQLDIRILGALEVRRRGALLPIGGHRQQAVLACLLVSRGSGASTGRLADAIWGEAPPAGYLTTLQTYVYRLRETLEPDRAKGSQAEILVTEGNGYRLVVPDDNVDARRFEGLVLHGQRLVGSNPERASELLGQALALWRDDPLADFADLEPVSREAARLDELRQSALEAWAQAELALGHHSTLAPELGRLVAAYPLREGLHAERMLALYRDGRQAEALAAFHRLRSTLDTELGIDPSSDLSRLHEQILRHDPSLDWRPIDEPDSGEPDSGEPDSGGPDRGERAPGQRLARVDPTQDRPPGVAAVVSRTSRRGRWTAIAAVLAVSVALVGYAVVRVSHADDVVPVPPNTVAMLSEHGLDGDAVPVSGADVALTSGAGSLWAVDAADDSVRRIDPRTRQIVGTFRDVGGSPQAVAVSGNDVWVAGYDQGIVKRINAETDSAVATIHVGTHPAAIVATPDQVWVANSGDDTVQRVDPHTNQPEPAIPVGSGPAGLALDGRQLWVANSRSATVTTLDTASGQRMASDVAVGSGARAIVVTGSDVWVADEADQSVARISRATRRPTIIPVDDGPSSLLERDGSVWVSNEFSGSVSRIDVATNTVRRIDLHSAPRALAVVDGQVWVATGAFGNAAHRGGTLVLTSPPGVLGDTIDPASAYGPTALTVLRPVYDGLVTNGVTGGLASETLVADLATSIPIPSDGGKTYIFTIRQGVRYSSGQEVVASDFVRGVRRALVGDGNPDLFSAINGAPHCTQAPADPGGCVLSEGVVADDATHRLTIRLSRPDPNLLNKLAYLVRPAPAGSPLTDSRMNLAVPGTGPYQVASADTKGNIVLTQNPYFQQWSFAAQPTGYADEIRYQPAPSQEQAVDDVTSGRADVLVIGSTEPSALPEHARVWPFHVPTMDWAYLNGTIPPFDDIRARRALNFAVDRRELVKRYTKATGAEPSCQLLPPGFPAYRRYCPYQTGPATGDYQGPDLEQARQLVRESGTGSLPIVVRAFHGPAHQVTTYDGFPAYLADVLRSIGYLNVTVSDIPGNAADADYTGYQIFTNFGWNADYMGPQTFFDQFSCATTVGRHFCSPAVQAVAEQAAASAQSDPGRSLELWTQVDHMLTDEGAFVTLGHQQAGILVSPRLRNIIVTPTTGPVLSQLWVK